MFPISKLWKAATDCLQNVVEQWMGAIVFLVLLVAGVILAFGYADTFIVMLTERKELAKNIAATIAFVFIAFGLILVVTFFGLFRGIKADEGQLSRIITYCYAFIVFSLFAPILPFIALPLIPQLYDTMTKSPVGIVAGCSVPSGQSDKVVVKGNDKAGTKDEIVVAKVEDRTVPKELRCKSETDQWVVNIGGSITSESDSKEFRLVQIRGGLVIPLYAVVLSLMGAAVSMTRRVPEYQRRISPGDAEYITFDQARERLVFQIMQVASAPLIVITAYYLVEPGSQASTIALSFAAGFSSETVLLLIRAMLEKLQPASTTAAPKTAAVGVAPERLDFGSVAVNATSKKSVSITNPGPATLQVTGITCGGEFLTTTTVPLNVAPQTSGVIALEFKPTSAGAKQAQLTIADNAIGSPRSVELTGTGT